MADGTASPQLTPAQQNAIARQAILNNAVDRIQQIFTQTFSAATTGVLNVQPRNVGLIKGFIVDVIASVTNSAGGTATLTSFGAANLLSQITLTDLQNNTRIQTAGWHCHLINTARSMKPFGLPFALNGTPAVKYNAAWGEISAPATIAASGNGTVVMRYYIPCAYSQKDLRGAIYANVTNASMNLQLTINPNFLVASGDATLAGYSGSAGGAGTLGGIGNVTVNVYQQYLDQLPQGQQGPILPIMDLSTVYELKNTNVNGLSVGQDFPIPYSNFRTFMSTFMVFDNGGTLNAGSDINYLALQSANYTNIWKMSPTELALLSEIAIGCDWPLGVYYASHRNRPINTSQFGNIQFIVNPSTVNAGAQCLVGYEDFAIVNTLNTAGGLPGG